MKKNKLFFIICCSLAVLILASALYILAGCKRTSKAPVVQPRQKTQAELAMEKINEYSNPQALISVYDLNNEINNPNLFILDTRARSYQVFTASYPLGHIAGAIPILHDEYSHPAYFDRVGTPAQLEKVLGERGANDQKRIVLYGNDGLQARLYWMLKMYGCVIPYQILDGGIEKWQAAGFQVTTQLPALKPSQFAFDPSKADPNLYTNVQEVIDAILKDSSSYTIIDGRTNKEFLVGHIPWSINISPEDLFNEDKTFKSAQEIGAILNKKGVTPDKTLLVYTQDGVGSSITWFALHELMGYPNVKNYDAGLNEWLERELAIEVGEQRMQIPTAQ